MDSDLSHEALRRFDEVNGHIGQLYRRIRRLEEHLDYVEPEPEELPEPAVPLTLEEQVAKAVAEALGQHTEVG